MMMKRKFLFLLLTAIWPLMACAQHFSPERTGGVYYAYPDGEKKGIDMPEGYVPFYISHYGRHGSRWLPSEKRYEWVAAQLAVGKRSAMPLCSAKNLTRLGKSVKRRLKRICRNARGNAGQLTPLGAEQHRGIARRMVQNYPSVFQGKDTRILARSSTSPRCRASMFAFCDALSALLHPSSFLLSVETNPEDMAWLNYESPEQKALTDATNRQPDITTDRFISSLFKDSSKVNEPMKLLSELHTIASDMQDIPLDISLWDIFTPEEMMAVHDANNERMIICNGDTTVNDGIPARSSIPLWQHIEADADSMIANGGHGAHLRFGHDTALYRLLTLLGIQLPGKDMEDIIPMAANLQMVFLRGEGKEERGEGNDSVLVAFLLNEHPCHLQTSLSLLYPWADVKRMMHERISQLEGD